MMSMGSGSTTVEFWSAPSSSGLCGDRRARVLAQVRPVGQERVEIGAPHNGPQCGLGNLRGGSGPSSEPGRRWSRLSWSRLSESNRRPSHYE